MTECVEERTGKYFSHIGLTIESVMGNYGLSSCASVACSFSAGLVSEAAAAGSTVLVEAMYMMMAAMRVKRKVNQGRIATIFTA